MAESDHESTGEHPTQPGPAASLPTVPKALAQPPPTPDPPNPVGAAMPLMDLLTLARAILRETGELPAGRAPAAPGPSAPGAAGVGGNPAAFLTPAQTRGPLPKEQKKFFKLGMPGALSPAAGEATPTPMSPQPLSPSEASSTPGEKDPSAVLPVPYAGIAEGAVLPEETAADDGASAADLRMRPSRPVSLEERTAGRRRSFTQKQRTIFLLLAVLLAGLAFAAGVGFASLRQSVAPEPVASANPGRTGNGAAPMTPGQALLAMATAPEDEDLRALKTIGEAMVARQARDWPKATALFERARQESPRVPSIAYRLAEVAMRRGDAIEADRLVNRAQELGENVDESFALRAVLAQRAGNSVRSLSLLESASRANPYESRYWLYQAQLLRQTGKLQEALVRLHDAAVRADEPAQVSLIELFIRLTTLELGREAEFNAELDAKLAASGTPPDWLVTAAARDFQHGRFTEGAATLRRALTGQPLPFAMLRLNDVFFRRYATRPEVAPVYAELLPTTAPPPLMNLSPPPAASSTPPPAPPAEGSPAATPVPPEVSATPAQLAPTATPAPSPATTEPSPAAPAKPPQ